MIPLITPVNQDKPESRPPPAEDVLQRMLVAGEVDLVQQLIDTHKLKYRIENGKLLGALEGTELWLKRFITVDAETKQMKDDVRKLAKVQDEVLITGETGTGKELVARAMIGDRKGRFVAVNCAGLPTELIESELFGHVKGSFTGAVSDKQGLMMAAKEGVLFLDEIAELPLAVQGKLLRALQDKKVRRVGDNKEEDITCKFVCATHRDVKQMVQSGTFRQDLYARLSTFEVDIKPLRDRINDVEPIIHALPKGAEYLRARREAGKSLSSLDLSLNVRSLQQVVKRYAVLGKV